MASKFVKRKLPAKASSNKVGTYQLVKKFAGYLARTDPTTIGPSYLVSPSQNVVTNT